VPSQEDKVDKGEILMYYKGHHSYTHTETSVFRYLTALAYVLDYLCSRMILVFSAKLLPLFSSKSWTLPYIKVLSSIICVEPLL
jgi:hypothetical protein